MKLVNEVFPIRPEFLSNPIVAAFENINFGAHPVLSILNMGLCENFDGQFNFYADCCSTAVAKVEDALDLERLAVGDSLHMHLRTELEANNVLYASHAKCIYDLIVSQVFILKLKMHLTHRKHAILQKMFHIYLFHFVNSRICVA